jgi:putative (di)nucleoside polyphosphate hydrolase
VIDADGFRPNVGIILTNARGELLWARRIGGQDAWQFPQGGIKHHESPEQALFRELEEEVGLRPDDVAILGVTRGWLRYRLPTRFIRQQQQPMCIGQKQKWFLLQFLAAEDRINVVQNATPEFDRWRWVSYWYPINNVVAFKRDVYRRALRELSPLQSYFQESTTGQELTSDQRSHIIALTPPSGHFHQLQKGAESSAC